MLGKSCPTFFQALENFSKIFPRPGKQKEHDMKIRMGLILWAAVAVLARAETNDVLQLWPGGAPGAEKWQQLAVTDDALIRPTLTIFLPPKEKANGTAVLVCPGGGYVNCMYTYEGFEIARWFNARGVAAFVLRYRRPVIGQQRLYDHTAPSADASRAMRLIRARAGEWNLNPQKVGIIGFSAGGHLAATMTVHFDLGKPDATEPLERQSSRPDFSVPVYAVINMNDEAVGHMGSRKNLMGDPADPKLAAYYSCELQVPTNAPPTFLVTGANDKTVPAENSVRMYQALKKAGVPAELHIFEDGPHGFGMKDRKLPVTDYWPTLLEAWLRQHGFVGK
jgi:acetyl esterase/lipase